MTPNAAVIGSTALFGLRPYHEEAAVTIYHGDCRQIVPLLGRFDLLLTDPPYGIDADNRKRVLSRSKLAAAKDYGESQWDKENGDNDFADGEMAWNNLGCALRIKRHLWAGMLRKGGEERHHPTQKPLEVIQWAMNLAGNVQTILDPWAGSGTTGHAAKNLGKRAVLIEREERYCEIAARRLAQDVLPLDCPNKD